MNLLLLRLLFFACISLMLWFGVAKAQSVTLAEGLRMATDENRLVKIREQEEKMARADVRIARSRLLPSLNASVGQTFLDQQPRARFGPQSVPTAERDFYTYRLALQQILYDFGGVTSQYAASRAIEETKRLETKRVKHDLALEFALLYFDILESEKLIDAAAREKDALTSHLAVARDRFAAGVITRNDLLQAEVKLADATQRLLSAGNLKRINVARLNSMLARPLNALFAAVDIADDRGRPLPPYEEAITIAEKERPEVQMLDATEQALSLEERALRAEYFPRFFLEGDYDYTKNKYQVHEGSAAVSFFMTFNLFAGGSTRAQVQKMRIARTRVKIERRKIIDDIGLQIERYYLEMANARERIKVTTGSVAQAEENLRISKIKYAEGVGIAPDVTDAIALLTLARTTHERARYDYERSQAGYLHATGQNLVREYAQ